MIKLSFTFCGIFYKEEMKGAVDKIWENDTKDNKQYHVLEIGGEKYSVWDPKLVEGLEEGSEIEYDWKKSGDYKKITGLRKLDTTPEIEPYRIDRKQTQIIRMSCLKSASELLHADKIDSVGKANQALKIARKFEDYVTSSGDEELDKPRAQEPG